METSDLTDVPSLLDLSSVEAAERAGTWTLAAPRLFPGLAINDLPAAPPVGEIRGLPMGAGWLWSVQSAPVVVTYSPDREQEEMGGRLSLLMQLEGSLTIGQGRRACVLEPGDMVLIDEHFPFQLQGSDCSHIAFVQMPRRAVLSRHPYLEHQTAGALEGAEAGCQLLRQTLLHTFHAAPFLREAQRGSVLAAIVQLLGAATSPPSSRLDDIGWRVRAALAFIETRLGDPELTAEHVARAQGISRRRLDQVLLQELGVSVTAHIWSRRLESAAAELANPAQASQPVSQIAYGAGFEDAAHFTRAFKRRFGHAPREWRALNMVVH